MKKLAIASACLALFTVSAIGAWANPITNSAPQITLSRSSSNNVVFSNNSGVLSFTFNGTSTQCGHANCLTGNASLDQGTSGQVDGQYWMWITGGSPTLSGNTLDDAVNMGTAVIHVEVKIGPLVNQIETGSMGDFIATLTPTHLYGWAGGSPQFVGSFTPTTETLDFSPGFPNNMVSSMSFNVDLPKGATGPLGRNHTVYSKISTGELDSPVPEPSSLALLGTGVLGLAAVIRRKFKV